MDISIKDACEQADIGRRTYYDHLNTDEEFAQRMSVAQSYLSRTAKTVVSKAIYHGNVSVAMWYLTRKDSDFQKLSQPSRRHRPRGDRLF